MAILEAFEQKYDSKTLERKDEGEDDPYANKYVYLVTNNLQVERKCHLESSVNDKTNHCA